MVSIANQNSHQLLSEVNVELGDGFDLKFETPSDDSTNYAFQITKQNMQTLYEQVPEWGWTDESKMAEVRNAKQHTLFVTDNSGERHGICCLRWLVENDEPVLYLYEIQLEEKACRRGFGTKMMTVVENIAARTRMSKVVLTVLMNNEAAMQFYRKLGYTNNEKLGSAYPYRILSKKIKPNPEAPLKFSF